jgi:TPR repeat protein
MRLIKNVVAAALLMALSQASWAGFAEGLAAAQRGDYATARNEFRPLAEQGNAAAQSNLGLIYRNGHGVPKDYVEAAKWYRLAAEQGQAAAQSNLGVMYANGDGVPEDYVEGYAWYNLAAAQGNKIAASNRASLRKIMTPVQVSKAQARSRELATGKPVKWQPSKPSKPKPPTNNLVRNIQSALASKGYSPGPADGQMGRKTGAAIRSFQRSIGLPPTGKPSPELLMLIRAK